MKLTRKEFLTLSSGAALSRAFPFASSSLAQDVTGSAVVQKIHKLIETQKEQHISRVQADLRQPSVSSWNMGIQEMADRMVASFRELGCKEADRVETDGFPGVFAFYDAGAPKTVVVYMMYDTQPFEKERWSRDPLAAERGPMGDFEDVIIARGAVNSKGPNRFFLNACQAILEVDGRLPVNVLFTCDGEEEQGSPHFHQVLDPYRERLRRAHCLLDAGPSQQRDGSVSMTLGTKGILEFELEASGERWGRGPQKMPIHSSRKAILDSPVWRLVDALRSMYDPSENRILIDGFYDDIRPPNEEESMLMETLIRKFPERLFTSEKENVHVFMKHWSPEEAARRLTFDTTMNIDGIWGGYTGPGSATILPEKAAAKIDCRLVPNQEIARQKELVLDHLARKGFSDLKLTLIGGGMEWSQTSVEEAIVQAVLAMYRGAGIDPMVWPRSAGSSPQYEYTRKLGLPACGGGLGHGGRAHADDEYIVIEGNDRVAGIVKAEQSVVDILFTYAAYPEAPRKS
jgi:acetylornithine deacetylase/succinyl-diaminopimelate desuccinylase-like protein